MTQKLKEDVYMAQKMYNLSQKLEQRVPAVLRNYSKNVLNNYICMAKEAELQLSCEELYRRILDE